MLFHQLTKLQNSLVGRVYTKGTIFLDKIASSLFMLFIRFWMASIFWYSGLTKISNWSATLYLFDNVYHVPDLSPTLAAYLSTLVEIVCPVLLVFGIMSRLAAIPMLVTTAVIQFTFLKSIDHTYWAILLGMILVNGPGQLSVDCFLKKKLSSIKRR